VSLASAFNFAPFYLYDFLSADGSISSVDRLVYMDGDILVLGDIAELATRDMKGVPCAAVQYCDQRLSHYINFTEMRRIGMADGINPEACIANRGLIVVDVAEWRRQKITEEIEHWLDHYRTSKADLWIGGMSQPPWLLALKGDNYARLGQEWNCNGLGRGSMSATEAESLWQ